MFDTTIPNHALFMANARRSVAQHAVDARYAEVTRADEIGPALLRFAKAGVQALVLMPGQVLEVELQRIVKFALAIRWPVIAGQREWADEGALLAYATDRSALYRRAAHYVDRILRGAKPGDLPIEQPMTIELVLNLKTAKALGLTMPPEIMVRTDKIIE